MSKPEQAGHTKGPIRTDKYGCLRGGGDKQVVVWGFGVAWGERHEEAEANAGLLTAAFNSYDKHCGSRAVELAEADLLGEALEVCRMVILHYEQEHGLQAEKFLTYREARKVYDKLEGK